MGQSIQADRGQTNVPISVIVDRDGGIIGLTVVIRIFNGDDLTEFLDFNDGTFKAAGHTAPTLVLPPVSAANAPGLYAVAGGFDLSAITIPAGVNALMVVYDITAGGETGNDVDVIELSERPISTLLDTLNRGADHNVKDSVGKQIRQASGGFGSDDVVSATATTIELDAAESSVDGFLNYRHIAIVDGLGVGQIRIITAYNGTTKIASVDRAWDPIPDVTSDYLVLLSSTSIPAADSLNAVRDAILDDATRFSGARVDAAISTRSSHSAVDVDTQLSSTHGAAGWEGTENTRPHFGVAFILTGTQLRLAMHAVRDGVRTTPVSFALTFRNPDGTTLFSLTEASPGVVLDGDDVYRVTLVQSLTLGFLYRAELSVTDATGLIGPRVITVGVASG